MLLTPITGTFGAELSGDRVADGIDGAWLSRQLVDHRLLVLRDQHLTHAQQVQLARALGEPTPAHPVVPGHPDHRDPGARRAQGGRNARWHRCHVHAPHLRQRRCWWVT
jgi:taurine dioxygenase